MFIPLWWFFLLVCFLGAEVSIFGLFGFGFCFFVVGFCFLGFLIFGVLLFCLCVCFVLFVF